MKVPALKAQRRFMQIDERAIVARVLAGYTDPNYEDRPGFFPFKSEADRIVTALEKARAAPANNAAALYDSAQPGYQLKPCNVCGAKAKYDIGDRDTWIS